MLERMRGLSLADFLHGAATRGPRFRSGPGRLKHAPKYRRPGDSPILQAWEVPVRVCLSGPILLCLYVARTSLWLRVSNHGVISSVGLLVD